MTLVVQHEAHADKITMMWVAYALTTRSFSLYASGISPWYVL
jgi:hypothetical protein